MDRENLANFLDTRCNVTPHTSSIVINSGDKIRWSERRMPNGKKWNYEEVKEYFKEQGCVLISEEYINSLELLSFRCRCGVFSEKTFIGFKRSSRCQQCGQNSSALKRTLKFDDVKEFYTKNNCTLISDKYINNNTRLSFICACGNPHESTFDGFKKIPRCPECGYINQRDSQKHSFEYVRGFFEENGCKLISTEYINSRKKLDYICQCGEKNVIAFYSFKNGTRCVECGIRKNTERMKHSLEYVINIFSDQSCVLLTTDYQNANQILDFICDCGNEGHVRLHDFIAGNRCKICVNLKRSISMTGVKRPDITGENHPQWDSSKTIEEREKGRFITEYKQCRSEVFRRDKFTCQCCGDDKGGNLNAHHIDGWDWCKDRRFDIDNIITLCDLCHEDFHNFYGYGNNTKEQWDEYLSELYSEIV